MHDKTEDIGVKMILVKTKPMITSDSCIHMREESIKMCLSTNRE
jgi:hypothetical protein